MTNVKVAGSNLDSTTSAGSICACLVAEMFAYVDSATHKKTRHHGAPSLKQSLERMLFVTALFYNSHSETL
jgi:hypothetical protein